MKFINDEFIDLVLSVVSEIPRGRVASYKQIAIMTGYPKNARQVGKVLSNADYYGDYPCHRVIHEDGSLVSFWDEQANLLEQEGITVVDNYVNMKIYRW